MEFTSVPSPGPPSPNSLLIPESSIMINQTSGHPRKNPGIIPRPLHLPQPLYGISRSLCQCIPNYSFLAIVIYFEHSQQPPHWCVFSMTVSHHTFPPCPHTYLHHSPPHRKDQTLSAANKALHEVSPIVAHPTSQHSRLCILASISEPLLISCTGSAVSHLDTVYCDTFPTIIPSPCGGHLLKKILPCGEVWGLVGKSARRTLQKVRDL